MKSTISPPSERHDCKYNEWKRALTAKLKYITLSCPLHWRLFGTSIHLNDRFPVFFAIAMNVSRLIELPQYLAKHVLSIGCTISGKDDLPSTQTTKDNVSNKEVCNRMIVVQRECG